MSTARSDTSSKRKKSTPQKFKSRKLFAASTNDILEQPEFSRARDGDDQENQLALSKLPVTLQNKENLPEECPNGSVTVPRGRGRPKGSKNKTFTSSATRVYDVRDSKSPDTVKGESDGDGQTQNGAATPHRGRGRPKGSTKVKPVGEIGPKRSRGRPKGSKNKKPSKAALLKMLASGQKIGRGRPRKSPIPLPHPPLMEPLTQKRGRGRPKGSLNKVPSAKRVAILSGSHDGKKRRGRPSKILLHTTIIPLTPKRPRGRPRVKTVFPEAENELSLLSGANDVKRKRGRPSKIVLHTTLIPLTPKRPRGRPRIKPLLPEPVNELTLLSGTNEVKRKRGRPRKNILHTELISLTPKRPRGRPRVKDLLPEPVNEVKSSESNTEEEDNTDDSEEFEEK